MKYAVVHFEYMQSREGNPYLFTVEGTPETKAEWEKYRGTTRQTMTLAELNEAGIELPGVINEAAADVQARYEESVVKHRDEKATRDEVIAALTKERDELAADRDKYVVGLNAIVSVIAGLADKQG